MRGHGSSARPLHYYFVQAMDRVWANLRQGTALPPSQVVHTVPRGGTPGAAPALTAANVPPIKDAPGDAEKITFGNNTATIRIDATGPANRSFVANCRYANHNPRWAGAPFGRAVGLARVLMTPSDH